MKKISIAVPCYNEAGNIEETYRVLKDVLDKLNNYDYEIIFGDNDSKDNSQEILRKLALSDNKVKVILNNRNFGPECNTYNIITSATGDACIFYCCDRQEPVELISEFIKEWENGAKVVWGQKISSNESKLMYFVRGLYYKIIKKFSDIPQYEQCIGFGLYDKSVLEILRTIKNPQPIIRNIIPDLGFKPVILPYKQNARISGKTSYNFFRYFDTALNSLINTSKAPMKIMIYIGMIFGFLSFLIGCIYFIYKLLHWNTFDAGIAPIIIIFSFFTSVQIFFLGFIGEYLLAVLDRVSFVKHVIEKERINFD